MFGADAYGGRSARGAWVVVAAVGLTAALMVACRAPQVEKASRLAVDGVLDLSAWDVSAEPMVPLDGQWRLSWGALVPPGEPLPDAVAVTVPALWSGTAVNGVSLPENGRATYRLTLRLPAEREVLALQVPPIRTAFRLYVDGRLAAEGGRLGTGPEDVAPAYAPTVIFIDRERPTVELTVHVANQHHRSGGIFRSLVLGSSAAVMMAERRAAGGDRLLVGAIFVMAIYHFGLFAVRRKERAALYFALYCLLVCVRLPLTGDMAFFHEFPEADLRWVLRVEYAGFALMGPPFCLFLASLYPRTWHKRVLRGIVGVSALLVLLFIVLPLPVMTRMLVPVQAIVALGVCYAGYSLVRAIYLRLDGAALFAAGFAAQAVSTANDMLYFNGLSPVGPLAAYGAFVFIIIQTLVLSRRFAGAYSLAESYASTFRKFVPTQFLRRIAKEGLDSIRLGNVEAVDISILFSDIRSFTTISERLGPDEVFAMLNRYLSRMEPPIQAQGGFVDKYIGDAIMALFDHDARADGARGAVEAALGMLDVLEAHNAELARAGQPQFQTGIGIHSGEVMIGTVGSDQRMDSTAIGDAVNLAARIEGMTKAYDADLLVSEHTVAALGEARGGYLLRFVDRVRVKGKNQPVAVWQVLGRVGDPRLAGIEAHLPTYAAALERYLARDFDGAATELQRFLDAVPDDTPAVLHLDRCRQFAGGVGEDWDGVISLTSK